MQLTIFAIILLTGLGLILMFLPGLFAKVIAMPMFAFCLPLISVKWIIVNDVTGIITTFALPGSITSVFIFAYTMLLYTATLNVFDALDRDWYGRKRKPRKNQFEQNR